MQRWQAEVTFEEARAHLGIQTQRQWSGKAIARTTPCLLALYSLVALAARHLFSTGQVYRRCAAWYPKPQATFSDTIAGVRRALWSHAYFQPHSMRPTWGKSRALWLTALSIRFVMRLEWVKSSLNPRQILQC